MKKYLTWLLLTSLTLLKADFAPTLYQTQLSQTDGKSALVEDRDIPVGSSGIVIHAFDKEHKTIVAEAVVTGKQEGKLRVTFRKFKRLHQAALPEYKIVPKKGDILILNYLYNRVLPITPDEAHFKSFGRKYGSRFEIIHPDLFASQLYFNHQPQPTKEDFQNSCRQNDTSLLYFEVGERGYFIDCNTFSILDTEQLTAPVNSKTAKQPFYYRIPTIKNRLGGILGGETIGDYNLYYKKLLGIK